MPQEAQMDEKELLLKLREGDEKVFASIFFKYFKPLCLFASRFNLNTEDAKDIVADVMLKLWESNLTFASFRHVKSYLYNAVRNGCLNHQVSAIHTAERQLNFLQKQEPFQDSYLNEITRAEVMMQLYKAIDSLPEQAGKIISMTYLQEKTNQETADELDLSVNTVKFQKRRGIALLRAIFNFGRLLIISTATAAFYLSRYF
ncbi:RNA polymerase sigma-70 factor, ECF subfamily [bacterium A37T11]|nr:RNA polymerase sigma-70 factor, ECF subfamily [bacterium A37T11]